MTTGSEAERAGMKDVISGRQATVSKNFNALRRKWILEDILDALHACKDIYAADWGIAYDLQRAKKCIEKEIRMTNEKDDARVGEFASAVHGDLPRPATGPFAQTVVCSKCGDEIRDSFCSPSCDGVAEGITITLPRTPNDWRAEK